MEMGCAIVIARVGFGFALLLSAGATLFALDRVSSAEPALAQIPRHIEPGTISSAGVGGNGDGFCFDGPFRISVLPINYCRNIYINMTPTSLILVAILYAWLHVYVSQFLGICRSLFRATMTVAPPAVGSGTDGSSLATERAERLRVAHLTIAGYYVVWAAFTAFPTGYSAFAVFIYVNDSYDFLLNVQLLLSSLQAIITIYTFCIFGHLEGHIARITSLYWEPRAATRSTQGGMLVGIPGLSNIVIGAVLFKIFFNIAIELSCGMGTSKMRTTLFLLSDLCYLGLIARWDGIHKPDTLLGSDSATGADGGDAECGIVTSDAGASCDAKAAAGLSPAEWVRHVLGRSTLWLKRRHAPSGASTLRVRKQDLLQVTAVTVGIIFLMLFLTRNQRLC